MTAIIPSDSSNQMFKSQLEKKFASDGKSEIDASLLDYVIPTLEEVVDTYKLKLIRDNWEVLKDKVGCLRDVKNGYAKQTEEQSFTVLDNYVKAKGRSNKVSYKFAAYKKEGRLFSDGPSLQGMNKRIRHTIAKDLYDDVDMVNCHPEIFTQLGRRHNFNTDALDYYAQNREVCLAEIVSRLGVDRDAGKTMVLKALNAGSFEDSADIDYPDWFVSLNNQCVELRKQILGLEEYKKYLDRAKKSQNARIAGNPVGSAINNVFVYYENIILQVMMSECEKQGVSIGALCFDGLMIRKDAGRDNSKFLRDMEGLILRKTKFNIKLSIKDMNEGVDLTDLKLQGDRDDVKDEEENSYLLRDVNEDSLYYAKKKHFEEGTGDFYQRHFKVLDSGMIGRIDAGGMLSFIKQKKAEDIYIHIKYTGISRGKVDTGLPFIVRWLKDQDMKNYRAADYYLDGKVPEKCLNLWEGFEVEKFPPINAASAKTKMLFKRLTDHMFFLSGRNKANYEYMFDWISLMFQKPWKSPNVCLLIVSDQGAGKGRFFHMLKRMVGNKHGIISQDTENHLLGNFNGLVEGKILIGFDEMSMDTFRKVQNKIKTFITEESIIINQKGLEPRNVNHCSHCLMFANSDTPIILEESDRRFFVVNIFGQEKPSVEYFEELEEAATDKGALRLFYESCMSRDISGFNPERDRPITDDAKELKKSTRDPKIHYLVSRFNENTKDKWFSTEDLYGDFVGFLKANYSVSKFNTMIHSCQSFGKFIANIIKKRGCKGFKAHRTAKKAGYDVRVKLLIEWLKDMEYRDESEDDDEEDDQAAAAAAKPKLLERRSK